MAFLCHHEPLIDNKNSPENRFTEGLRRQQMSNPLPPTHHGGLCFSQENENLSNVFRLHMPFAPAPRLQMLNPTVPATVGLLPHFLSGKVPTTQTPPEGQESRVFPGPGGPSTVHGCPRFRVPLPSPASRRALVSPQQPFQATVLGTALCHSPR